MLLIQSNFINRYAIRSSVYLENPLILAFDEVIMPRGAVFHYLDTFGANRFPNRNMWFMNGVDEQKKIFVDQILDLVYKESTGSLNNLYVGKESKKWRDSHKKNFRQRNLLKKPNVDESTMSVINYNLIKDLYKYRDTVTQYYDYCHNLLKSQHAYMQEYLKADSTNFHFFEFRLPNIIPGFEVMNRLLGFEPKKLSRIFTDVSQFQLLELYRYLVPEYRKDSIYASLKPKDAHRTIICINYQGFTIFLPLKVIMSIEGESPYAAHIKLKGDRYKRFLLAYFIDLQDRMNKLSETKFTNSRQLDSDEDPLDYKSDDDYEKEIEEEDGEVRGRPEILRQTEDEIDDEKYEAEEAERRQQEEEEKGPEQRSKDRNLTVRSNARKRRVEKLLKEIDKDEFIRQKEISILDQLEKYDTYGSELLREPEEDKTEETTVEEELSKPVDKRELERDRGIEEKIEKYIDEGKKHGTVTDAQIRSIRTAQDKRAFLKNPYVENMTMDELIQSDVYTKDLTKNNAAVEITNSLVSDDLKTVKLKTFTKDYATKVYKKEILDTVMSLEKSNIIITDYQIQPVKSIVDDYETHIISVKPLKGVPSTLYLRMPVLREDGSFMAAGNEYTLRKVKHDLPIRKISPDRVALASNYGKFFVSRTERVANDPKIFIQRFITNDYLTNRLHVQGIVPGRKKLNTIKNLPTDYYALASEFNTVITHSDTFLFDLDDDKKNLTPEVIEKLKEAKLIFIGFVNSSKDVLAMNQNNIIINYTTGENRGTIYEIFDIPQRRIPSTFSSIKVLGTDIPFGVCMSYLMGISNLIRYLDITYQLVPSGKRYTLQQNETELRFFDYKLILTLDTEHKKLIMNGFVFYKDFIKQYKLSAFDNTDIYLNLIQYRGCDLIHLKELKNLEDLFLDPITIDVLKEMKEPDEFRPLLFRANQLLSDYSHPDITDATYSRIRGNERIVGLMYKAISESVREHNIRGRVNSQVKIDPYKVWNYITQDNSLSPKDVVNPILSLKNEEIITLTGRDGLRMDAVSNRMREYHPTEAGLVGESTADSSNAGLVNYLTPYAKIKNLRGMVEEGFSEIEENPAKLLTSPIQISPMSEYDDPKRISYTAIQFTHTIPNAAYHQPALRTTYESLIPFKVPKEFALMAEQPGVVTEASSKRLSVQYEDGSVKTYNVGATYGQMEGTYYRHNLLTGLRKGDKFNKEDPLYYHKDFFEQDWLNRKKIIFKTNCLTTVALTMNSETFEDSSAISKRLSKRLKVETPKIRRFVLDFETNVEHLVKPGDQVDFDSVIYYDTVITESGGNISDATRRMLESLASSSPTAKYKGVVDKIEIRYNGEISNMSPSLAKIATQLDKEHYELTKGTDKESRTCAVSSEYSSKGKRLELNSCEITVYILTDLTLSNGDKIVVGNQAKSVISNVYNYTMIGVDSKQEVDVMFSYVGFMNRMIASPFRMATNNKLLEFVGLQIASRYLKNKKS